MARFSFLPTLHEDSSQSSIELESRARKREKDVSLSRTELKQRLSPFPWTPFLVVSTLPFALAPIIILATAAEEASQNYLRSRDCYPNGMWRELHGATWRIMDSSYFFTPNLAFGAMSFTSAKLIDICWDLLVGRGIQILLAYVNWKVFNEWLIYHMEIYPTSYKLFTSLAFSTTSLSTLGVLGKEFLAFGETNWRRFFRWLTILCMLISTLYVLSFPTLMAAMTGYITTYGAYVEVESKDLIAFQKFEPVQYMIKDSSRIGYSKPLVATFADDELGAAIKHYIEKYMYNSIHLDRNAPFNNSAPSIWNFNGSRFELEAPTLDIIIGGQGSNTTDDMRDWHGASTPVQYFTYRDYNNSAVNARQGDTYSVNYMLSHGSCKPSETYQWGFSYIFLFMVSIFNFIWSTITVCIWFDTQRSSWMYKAGRRPGLLRSIMDVSTVMMEEIGPRAKVLKDDELRERLRTCGSAMYVEKRELRVVRTGSEPVKRKGWGRINSGSTF